MEIEDLKRSKENDWFPLPKGYNRILIVLAMVIIITVACLVENEDHIFISAILTLFIELCIYFALVWIYRGFKDFRNE